MSKALDVFIKRCDIRLLFTSEERALILNQLRAISCIEARAVYNIKENKIVFVNKLIYFGDDLMIIGYSKESNFKVDDYGITWREVGKCVKN